MPRSPVLLLGGHEDESSCAAPPRRVQPLALAGHAWASRKEPGPLGGFTPVVRRAVGRLKGDSLALCLAADRSGWSPELEAQHARRRVLLGKRFEVLEIVVGPRLA